MKRLARIGVLAALLLSACVTNAAAESKIDTAREHLANQEVDQAYALLVTLVDTNTAESDEYLFLGVLERDRGALQRAINVFEQGVSKGSTDAALLSELAMTYAWDRRFREALQTYERILGKTPDHRGALLGSARVLAWAGRDSKAMSIYKAVLQDDPSDLEAMRGLAFVRRSRLELREAKALYHKVLSEAPDDAESLEGLRSIQQTKRLRLEAAFGVALRWLLQARLQCNIATITKALCRPSGNPRLRRSPELRPQTLPMQTNIGRASEFLASSAPGCRPTLGTKCE